MNLLARCRIFEYRARGGQYRHHRRRRSQPHTRLLRRADYLRKTSMNLSKDRLRRNKHDRPIRRLSRNDIFLGNVFNVFFNIEGKLLFRLLAFHLRDIGINHALKTL